MGKRSLQDVRDAAFLAIEFGCVTLVASELGVPFQSPGCRVPTGVQAGFGSRGLSPTGSQRESARQGPPRQDLVDVIAWVSLLHIENNQNANPNPIEFEIEMEIEIYIFEAGILIEFDGSCFCPERRSKAAWAVRLLWKCVRKPRCWSSKLNSSPRRPLLLAFSQTVHRLKKDSLFSQHPGMPVFASVFNGDPMARLPLLQRSG
jgi:hypothetical protein